MEMLACSDCGKEILGSGCIVADAGDPKDPQEWGELFIYPSTEGGFALLHPNCFKKFQDECLRQERGAVINVALGKVEWIREALEIG